MRKYLANWQCPTTAYNGRLGITAHVPAWIDKLDTALCCPQFSKKDITFIKEKIVNEKKLNVKIDSAGTGDWHIGEALFEHSIKVASLNGIDISQQKGRQFQKGRMASLLKVKPRLGVKKNWHLFWATLLNAINVIPSSAR